MTAESLRVGIQAIKPGSWTTDISKAIQTYVESQGYSVVREYTGHGIGRQMHEDPQVPNYYDPRSGARSAAAGMTIALEPMVNVGVGERGCWRSLDGCNADGSARLI